MAATTWLARADVLVCTNGERFVGTVIEETTNVVFNSEFGGRLVIPQTKIREDQRTPSGAVTNAPVALIADGFSTNPASWKPPGVGSDGSDWVQLKSGEWFCGQKNYATAHVHV